MANTIDWGQGAVNNTIDWGKGKTNATNNWGAIYDSTAAGETNITGSGGVTPFTNTYSMSLDGVDEWFNGASTFSELNGLNKATFSMWVKPTSLSVGRILFHTPRNTTASHSQILLWLRNTGALDFSMDTSSYYARSVSGAITAGVWNHILIGVDLATAGNIQMFVNGIDVLDVQNMGSRVSFATSSGAFYIGEDANGYLNPLLGEIDEFAMWVNSDQSANVSDIYNGGVPFDLSTLATAPSHWWRMGDNDTWSGSQWTLSDNIGSYDLNSINMEEADRVTDVP